MRTRNRNNHEGRFKSLFAILEKIRKDLEVNELDLNLVYDKTIWSHLTHVADPT